MRYIIITILFLLINLTSCSSEQYVAARKVETGYAELYLAINSNDAKRADVAAKQFERDLNELFLTWAPTLGEEELDELYFRIDRANRTWIDMQLSIKNDDLPLAMLQLDRAIYELNCAHPESFHQLHLGRLYMFTSSWYGLNDILQQKDYCAYTWFELERYAGSVQKNLTKSGELYPSEYPLQYFSDHPDEERFKALKEQLANQIKSLTNSIELQDTGLIEFNRSKVDETLNDVFRLFAQPVFQ